MVSSPLVSVVIPAYNHEPYLGEAIASVLNQTLGDLELIVIDDGSQDQSYQVAQGFLQDPRVRVLRNPANLGAPMTLNKGLFLAQGQYCTILNSDDIYGGDRLEQLVQQIEVVGADLLGTDLGLINASSEAIADPHHWWWQWFNQLKDTYHQTHDLIETLLTGNIFMTTSNFFFKTALFQDLGGFADYRYTHDYEWLFRALTRGKVVHFDTTQASLSYRLHGHNTILECPLKANQETFVLLTQYLPQFIQEGHDRGRVDRCQRYLQTIEGYIEQEYHNQHHQAQTEFQGKITALLNQIQTLGEQNQTLQTMVDQLQGQQISLHHHNATLQEQNHTLQEQQHQHQTQWTHQVQQYQCLEVAHQQLQNEREAIARDRDGWTKAFHAIETSASYRLGYGLLQPARHVRNALQNMTQKITNLRHRLGLLPPGHRVSTLTALQPQIMARLATFDIISFDLFDTLITRRLAPPEVIHRRVAEFFRDLLPHPTTALDLLKIRRQQEAALRTQALEAGHDHECHLDAILAAWVEGVLGQANPEICQQLRERELFLEGELLFPTQGALALLKELQAQGKIILAISDMYLGKEELAKILENLELLPFLDGIFVSSDFLVGKYSGRLFQHVLNHYGCEPQRVVHIGDNFISDYVMPRRQGIQALHLWDRQEIKRRRLLAITSHFAQENPYWKGRDFLNLALSFTPPQISTNHSFYYRYGYEILGPCFAVFTHQLLDQLRDIQPDKLFFLARDGYLLQQLYTKFLSHPGLALPSPPTTDYLHLSRKVTFAASLVNGLSWDRAVIAFYNPQQQGFRSLLKTFSLPEEAFLDLAQKHGFLPLDQPLDDPHDPRLLALLADSEFQASVQQFGKTYQQLMEDYLRQHGFFDHRKVALVDIGWNGTIQYGLDQLFQNHPQQPALHGFYFGFCGAIPYQFSDNCTIHGVFYDERRHNAAEGLTVACEEIFEEAARSSEGSTVGYTRVMDAQGQGHVQPQFKGLDEASRQAEVRFQPQVDALQAGILDFADVYLKAQDLTGYGAAEIKPYVLTLLERAIAYPRDEEAFAWTALTHAEDFGLDSTLEFSSLRSPWTDLLRPQAFRQRLGESPWKYAVVPRGDLDILRIYYRIREVLKQS